MVNSQRVTAMVQSPLVDEERERAARAAAERVFEAEDGEEPDYVEPDDELTADIAVRHLKYLFSQLPGRMRTALASARASGDLISRDPLQGISEVLQNADDLGARTLQIQLRPGELLFAHDGAPVTLSHALALATPWLSTKGNDSRATGRFGIGLTALQSLGDVLDVYCDPYRIRIGSPSIDVAEPLAPPPSISGAGWTLLRVPIASSDVALEDIDSWLRRWDDSALLFLRSVAAVSLHDDTGKVVRKLQLRPASAETLPSAQVRGAQITRQGVGGPRGLSWIVYSSEPPGPSGVRRAHKATAKTTPIAVGLQVGKAALGQIHAGLPLVAFDAPCRLNAQFDPLTNRNDLASTAWNRALFELLAELWTEALLDLFRTNPRSAWLAIPMPSDEMGGPPDQDAGNAPAAQLADLLLHTARDSLSARLTLTGEDGVSRPLSSYAVESMPLEGVLTPSEIAELAGLDVTLPPAVRDHSGRWREVLRDWREAGAMLPVEVGVEAVVELLGEEMRTPESVIRLTSIVLAEGLENELNDVRCIVTEAGPHVPPPRPGDPVGLAEKAIPLAQELGLVHVLHPAYLAKSASAVAVLKWLRSRESIVDEGSPASILDRLAAVGRSGREPIRLTDEQLQVLREVFERLPKASREELGSDVGRGISLSVYEYVGRKRVKQSFASPVDAYLPAAIDREPDSFPVAAADTPGILWLDNRYRDLLRSQQGRQGLGAQAFLRLLGGATAPRLQPHPSLFRRYQSDWREGLARSFGSSDIPERVSALRQLAATYTLEDRTSGDLFAVIWHIARERGAGKRRRRAAALLSTMGRAWDRLGEHADVDAVSDSYGWVHQVQVKAFWLWQAASVPWLDNASGKPCRPAELRVRTDATLAIYGRDSSDYLHPALDGGNRRGPLGALGVHGEPTMAELVERLRDLRAAEPSSSSEWREFRTEVAVVYQALAFGLGPGSTPDMGRVQLRRAFSQGDGLILTSGGWRKPPEVRRGAPFLGNYADFVPSVPDTERLWLALDVRLPDVWDCVEALRRMGRRGGAAGGDDGVVALETFRFLVAEARQTAFDDRERRALRSLALRTSKGWLRDRPIYAVDNPQLADALGELIPVWEPGGDLDQFRSLLDLLRVTPLDWTAFDVVHPEAAVVDEEQTQIARLALAHLRADLERNAPAVAKALRIGWDELQQFVVKELPSLGLRTTYPRLRGVGLLDVSSWLDHAAGTIYVRDLRALPRADGGGQAIASLFAQHHRQVAQAWRVAYDAAEDGRRAELIRTAEERARAEADLTQAGIRDRTKAFQARVEPKTHGGTQSRVTVYPSPRPQPTGGAGAGAPAPRVLVNPNNLRLEKESVQATGGEPDRSGALGGGGKTPSIRQGKKVSILRKPNLGGASPNSQARPRDYTEGEKESLGLELVRWLLASDVARIVDIRGQRGVGADAVDDLERFYELKVSAGDEPNSISLTDKELQRALTTPDYFLVIVSGLEGEDAKPRIRVLVDPLRQLRAAPSSSVAFTGVRDAGGIVYEFGSGEEDEAG